MDKSSSMPLVVAFALSTAIVAVVFGAFAAWAFTRLGSVEHQLLGELNARWIPGASRATLECFSSNPAAGGSADDGSLAASAR